MSILKDLISEMKVDDEVDKIRILCDRILEEEHKEMKWIHFRPQGANIFLALQVPGPTKHHVGFLSLERETEDLFLGVFWSMLEKDLQDAVEKGAFEGTDPTEIARPKKMKVNQIEDHRPEKILTAYAKLIKFYHGE